MKLTKRLTALALSAVMALGLAACGGSSGSSSDSGSNYRTLYSSEVTTMNYLITGSTNEYEIGANVVDCLVEYDNYGVVQPSLAESWEHNDDYTQWTFHIRKGVKWVDSEGKEVADVTANDWVSAAHYVCDAANDSATEYMYEGYVKNAAEYYAYTAYMLESENGTLTTNADGEAIEPVDKVDVDSIGVSATDDYTLVYDLESPCSFFISLLSYACYMPVYGSFLEEQGANFGLDNQSLLYCGAYILSDFAPQEQHVFTKNPTYWDADHVYIETITQTYNSEADTLSPTMYLSGEVDQAYITSDLLTSWMDDKDTSSLVHSKRLDNSFSYFYLFNFDPQFDAEYEPDNWSLAVNNENFRKSLMYALDRVNALSVSDPYNPSSTLNNTITPADFAVGAGKDYTTYDPLSKYTADGFDYYNTDEALSCKDAAIKELTAAGATFPVKVLMPYNPSTPNWEQECIVVEQQLESVLGSDYVDVVIEAGPESGFLSAIRRSGCYAFMKCNWGADYADPQTWTDPFTGASKYSFIYNSKDQNTLDLFDQYMSLVDTAKAIYNDDEARYTAFAQAEAFLIEHAFAVPYSVNSVQYQVCDLNPFEAEYAPYGMASLRYKFQHLYDTSMSQEDFNKASETWQTERAAALKAAAEQ